MGPTAIFEYNRKASPTIRPPGGPPPTSRPGEKWSRGPIRDVREHPTPEQLRNASTVSQWKLGGTSPRRSRGVGFDRVFLPGGRETVVSRALLTGKPDRFAGRTRTGQGLRGGSTRARDHGRSFPALENATPVFPDSLGRRDPSRAELESGGGSPELNKQQPAAPKVLAHGPRRPAQTAPSTEAGGAAPVLTPVSVAGRIHRAVPEPGPGRPAPRPTADWVRPP